MKVKLIAAVARNRAIGHQGQLLFHLLEDMARFRRLTTGHPVIMGRKTYESLPHGPLPHRRNIVLSRQAGFHLPWRGEGDTGLEVCPSLEEALRRCASQLEVFVIGGAEVYRQAIDLAEELWLTEVEAVPAEADAFSRIILPGRPLAANTFPAHLPVRMLFLSLPIAARRTIFPGSNALDVRFPRLRKRR